MAHSVLYNPIRRSSPQRGKTLKVEYLGEFESIFEIALDHESGDLIGSFGEITFDKISHATDPLTYANVISQI